MLFNNENDYLYYQSYSGNSVGARFQRARQLRRLIYSNSTSLNDESLLAKKRDPISGKGLSAFTSRSAAIEISSIVAGVRLALDAISQLGGDRVGIKGLMSKKMLNCIGINLEID